VQVSTDCVFDGARGRYTEDDHPNATDLYGRTKALGEVGGPRTVTVRTSMIGRQLAGDRGLVEWFLSHRGGAVDGFAEAWFSGLSTAALARTLLDLVTTHAALTGVYHVAADPINKYDLLGRLNVAFAAGIDIRKCETPRLDRTLDGRRFRQATGFASPSWDAMIAELAGDTTPYDQWRNRAA
jgi:dTDP-4-dehydrorhamnose reductase